MVKIYESRRRLPASSCGWPDACYAVFGHGINWPRSLKPMIFRCYDSVSSCGSSTHGASSPGRRPELHGGRPKIEGRTGTSLGGVPPACVGFFRSSAFRSMLGSARHQFRSDFRSTRRMGRPKVTGIVGEFVHSRGMMPVLRLAHLCIIVQLHTDKRFFWIETS